MNQSSVSDLTGCSEAAFSSYPLCDQPVGLQFRERLEIYQRRKQDLAIKILFRNADTSCGMDCAPKEFSFNVFNLV